MASGVLPRPDVRTRADSTTQAMPCPCCGRELEPISGDGAGMVTCTCGHRAYAGYIAEAASLQARLDWLHDRVAAGDPAPPADLARRYGVWPAPPPPGHLAEPSPAIATQTLLLTLGAALLILAAAVFAAVMWEHLGVVGQVLLLGLLTVGVAGLALWLRPRLERTAEALAAVAFGLAVIDLVAAPRLGFLPEPWSDVTEPYPFVAAFALGALALVGGHARGVRTWVWAGWSSVAVGLGLLAAAAGEAAGGSPAAFGAALALVTVPAVGVLVLPVWADDRGPVTVVGGIALGSGSLAIVGFGLAEDALPGALAAALATAFSLGVAWRVTRRDVLGLGAVVGLGVSVALTCCLPADPQPAWLGVVVGLAGGALFVPLARGRHTVAALAGLLALWGLWSLARVVRIPEDVGPAQDAMAALVGDQLGWLAITGGAVLFVVAAVPLGAAVVRHLAWPAPVLLMLGLVLLAPAWAPSLPEAVTLPLAALLLLAGLLATRDQEAPSLVRYGPAVAVALVPSAVLAWGAPWVAEGVADTGDATEHVVRLLFVLVCGGGLVVVGAWRHLAGVLEPAALAVAIAAGAQVWTGVLALPRWIALGLAGAALVAAGARIEWLRREGHRASTWLHHLT